MQEKKVFVLNKQGEKLAGIEALPNTNNGKFPAVILVHGIGVNKDEYGMFVNLQKKLTDQDIAVYRFDFSGCGESEGDILDTTLTKLRGDLEKILEFVREQKNVDRKQIGILAQSFGTSCTVALKPGVKCIVLMGSVAQPEKSLAKYFGENYNPTGISTKEKSSGVTLKVKPEFWKDLKKYNLVENISKIHCPILLLHGSADKKISPSETETFFEKANEPKEKIIIEGASHGMEPHRDKMYQIVTVWFSRHLS